MLLKCGFFYLGSHGVQLVCVTLGSVAVSVIGVRFWKGGNQQHSIDCYGETAFSKGAIIKIVILAHKMFILKSRLHMWISENTVKPPTDRELLIKL